MTKYHVEGVLELTRFRRGNSGGASGTVDVQVGAGADDGRSWTAGGYSNSESTIDGPGEIDPNTLNVWLRFTSVSIPQGSTIDVAYITVIADRTDRDGIGLLTKVSLEDADDPAAPTDAADHVGRSRTTAGTDWDDEDFVIGASTNSPDISTAIKEVTDRGGWVSGQAMLVFWDDDGSDENHAGIESYESDTSKAAKLHVEWTS